jgi:predicted regulator of Ras-like GTPase activity (Roadblock/LC7/MglB family)
MSPFHAILRTIIDRVPGALGGAFAAYDGELVDSVVPSDPLEWAILTAHYGVLLGHVQSALRTMHHGEAELIVLSHDRTDILLRSVAEGYYAILAVGHPAPLGLAIEQLDRAVVQLRREM